MAHRVPHRQGILNETRFIGNLPTAELVGGEVERLKSGETADCRRNGTCGMEGDGGKKHHGKHRSPTSAKKCLPGKICQP